MIFRSFSAILTIALSNLLASANVHLWHFEELYSNAEGTLQFVEIDTTFTGQQFLKTGGNNSRFVSRTTGGSTHATYFFPNNLPSYALISGHRKALIGTASLAGIASVTPDFVIPDNFLLPEGGRIDFVSDLHGTFHFATYPALQGGAMSYYVEDVMHGPNTPTNFANVTGAIPPPPLPIAGDYNNDLAVDAADYPLWRDTLGDTLNLTADGNKDDMVTQVDYDWWRDAFGGGGGSGAVAVPEPAGTGLALLGGAMVLVARRRMG